jgi:mono/diheme cytochrome c family protein
LQQGLRRSGRALAHVLMGFGAAAVCAAADSDDIDRERGRRLLAQYQCGSCHVIPGVEGAIGHAAPTLAAFGRRHYIAGQLPHSADTLVRWIVTPASQVPNATMPAMGAGLRDARDMAAYLRTLR